MNSETLIALAKESGLWTIITRYTKVFAGKSADPEDLIWSDLEYFAALIAAHEREECAKVVEAEQTRVLGKQEGDSWEPVNINIRMTTVLLPDIAAAIRSRT